MESLDTSKKSPSVSMLIWIVSLGLIGIALFILVWKNRHSTHVDLLLWEVHMRIFILVPFVFLLGFLGGWAFKTFVSPRRSAK